MPLQCTIPLQTSDGRAIPAGCFNSFEYNINFPDAQLVDQYFVNKAEFDTGKDPIRNTVFFDNAGTLEPISEILNLTINAAQYAALDTPFIENFVKNRLEAITGPGTWNIVPY